jgi:hypothetical protein
MSAGASGEAKHSKPIKRTKAERIRIYQEAAAARAAKAAAKAAEEEKLRPLLLEKARRDLKLAENEAARKALYEEWAREYYAKRLVDQPARYCNQIGWEHQFSNFTHRWDPNWDKFIQTCSRCHSRSVGVHFLRAPPGANCHCLFDRWAIDSEYLPKPLSANEERILAQAAKLQEEFFCLEYGVGRKDPDTAVETSSCASTTDAN